MIISIKLVLHMLSRIEIPLINEYQCELSLCIYNIFYYNSSRKYGR